MVATVGIDDKIARNLIDPAFQASGVLTTKPGLYQCYCAWFRFKGTYPVFNPLVGNPDKCSPFSSEHG